MRPSRAAIGKRVLALLLGFILALSLAEALLRAFQLTPAQGVATVLERQFTVVPGLFAPGQALVDRRHPALPHTVRIDSLGYRGRHFPRVKDPGELRILMVGDSYTYGDFVDDSLTLPAQLADRLRHSCHPVRVINAGIGGTTITEHIRMVERALPLNPDVVVLSFSENDVADLAVRPLWDQLADNRRMKSRFPISIVYPVLRQTALWNLLLKVRGKVRSREAPTTPAHITTGAADPSVAQLRARYLHALVGLRDTLRARGIPLVFVIFPSHHAVASADRRAQIDWALRIGEDAGLPTLSLLGALSATGLAATALYLLPHDGHPSPRGYGVAADTLAASLARYVQCPVRLAEIPPRAPAASAR